MFYSFWLLTVGMDLRGVARKFIAYAITAFLKDLLLLGRSELCLLFFEFSGPSYLLRPTATPPGGFPSAYKDMGPEVGIKSGVLSYDVAQAGESKPVYGCGELRRWLIDARTVVSCFLLLDA